jgi:REP element-mobilizing transposase RayT
MYSPKMIVQTIKSITAREIMLRCPEVKKKMWGGRLWTAGYFISTVGQHGNEKMIGEYIKRQGREKEYKRLHNQQLKLFGAVPLSREP